jgi:o-succinylbenzoate synthase
MKIERIELHHLSMPLVQPFETSLGLKHERDCILVAIYGDGLVGWGECVAGMGPWYSPETIGTAWHILADYLVPAVLGQELAEPTAVLPLLNKVRGHQMAKAAVENALWDWFAQAQEQPLCALLGGVRSRVAVGVSIGIQPSVGLLVEKVGVYVGQGYGRVKIKIKQGWALEPVRAVRAAFPDVPLMVDANSDFGLADAPLFQQMDNYHLLMIEQPLANDDILEHAKLQAQIETAVCLDESIHSLHDARMAVELSACRVINMKVGRVGGLSSALAIHALCQHAGIALWCGGMLETAVGRALNVHLASLPAFTLPGDISATDRYWQEDIADPPFVLNEDSTISVPTAVGLGVQVDLGRVAKYRLRIANME